MNAVVLPIFEGTRHAIVVTLSAREVMRITHALDECENEYSEEYGYSTMAVDFDKLYRRLEQEGFIDTEYQRERPINANRGNGVGNFSAGSCLRKGDLIISLAFGSIGLQQLLLLARVPHNFHEVP